MQQSDKRFVWVVIAIVGTLLAATGFFLATDTEEKAAPSWSPAVEGFLAVATPCCSEASLWDSLDQVTDDGQHARPATVAEAARWLNDWPYRKRGEENVPDEAQLGVAAQSSEIRCSGAATGPEIPHTGDDEQILKAVRRRPECQYVKWKVWNAKTGERHLNERHVVWADERGFFHGRVELWE